MYDDIRDTRPWFWVLVFLLFAVAAVGLIVAISAKNSSVDEKKVVNDATAQIREELTGLNGALKTADRVQKQQSKEAARDRARIRRAIAKAQSGVTGKLRKLNARVATLEGEMTKVKDRDAKLRKNLGAVAREQEAMADDITLIKRLLRGQVGGVPGNDGN